MPSALPALPPSPGGQGSLVPGPWPAPGPLGALTGHRGPQLIWEPAAEHPGPLPLGFYTALRHWTWRPTRSREKHLQPGVFQALPHLEHLNLAHSRLAVPDGAECWGTGPVPRPGVPGPVGEQPGHSGLVERLLGRRLPCAHSLAENSLAATWAAAPLRSFYQLERLDLHSNVLMDIGTAPLRPCPA